MARRPDRSRRGWRRVAGGVPRDRGTTGEPPSRGPFLRALLAAVLALVPLGAGAVEAGASAGIVHESDVIGPAFDLRLLDTRDAGEVQVSSEVGGKVALPGEGRLYALIAGWRVRFGEVVRPGVIVHLGIGHLRSERFEPFTDGIWEVGGLLDLVPSRRITVGAHVVYTGFFAGVRDVIAQCPPGDPRCPERTGNPNMLGYGLHAAFRL